MSLKPITEIEGLANKSLNLYANSVNANEISGSTIDLENIQCETLDVANLAEINDLVATGNTCQLRGGNMPSSTSTTAGYLLTNTDGTGNLQWTDATQLFPSSSFPVAGIFTSTVSASGAGSVISASSDMAFNLVGSVMTCSGTFAIDTTATGDFIEIDLTLPLSKKPKTDAFSNATCSGGVGTKDNPAKNVISINSGQGVSVNNLGITLSPVQGTTFTAQTGIICCYTAVIHIEDI